MITLPTLIAKHRKNLIETRLKNFYTTINQAIKMAEADYGDKKDWFSPLPEECESDKDSQNCLQTFYDKYLKNILSYIKYFIIQNTKTIILILYGYILQTAVE